MFKRFPAYTLALSLLAVSLSACGTTALDAADLSTRLRAQSSSGNFLDDVFAILDDDGTGETATSEQSAERAAARAARIEALKTSNPELVAELEALQALDVTARAERLQAIREAYPELFHGGKGPGRGHGGPGGKMGRPGMGIPGLAPAALASSNPELAAALAELQDLTPEERKAKMDALREEHPDWFPAPPVGRPAARPGRGGPGGHHMGFFSGPMASPNPELAAALAELKDLTPEERKAKIDALREEHPDWFPVRPTPSVPATP